MKPSLSSRFVDKSCAALVAAIEVYNKPGFPYRAETFALLALNAWELVLKAKLLHENNNDPKSIYEYEKRPTKTGKPSTKKYVKRNRAGNAQTITLGRALALLDQKTTTRLNPAVKANLDALIEIRDNCAHFVNATPVLEKQILEIGTASVRNFVCLCKAWFKKDFSKSISLLMPLGFIDGSLQAAVVSVNSDERNLIKFLKQLASDAGDDSEFQVALSVDVSFQRSQLESAARVVVVKDDPSATKVELSEEDIRKNYPWDYRELVHRLVERYTDFKQDRNFHNIRKPLTSDPRFVKRRFLDPGNPKSQKKDFYNSNVMQIFDAQYTKK